MAFTSIIFENTKTGSVKEAPVGFSWTTFFFGIMPAIFRGDWKWSILMLVLAPFTLFISTLVFPFIYNKLYIKELLASGYKAKSISRGEMKYVEMKLGIDLT